MKIYLPTRICSDIFLLSDTYADSGIYEAHLNKNGAVSVKCKKDYNGRKSNKPTIELRAINAREAIKDVMKDVISLFPSDIPKYYGKTEVNVDRSRY